MREVCLVKGLLMIFNVEFATKSDKTIHRGYETRCVAVMSIIIAALCEVATSREQIDIFCHFKPHV